MITILELAQELDTTKTTISRKIRELNIKNDLSMIDGKYYLTDDQADLIRGKMKRGTFRDIPPHVARNVSERGTTNNVERTATDRNAEQDAQTIQDLMAQLREKDTQIKELHKLLDQQQQLNMITQQRLVALEDKQQAEPRGFFRRLFTKKDTGAQDHEQEQGKQDEGN